MIRTSYQRATPADRDFIVDFQIAMALETEGLELDRETCRKGVQAVFDSPDKGIYYVARRGDEVVASLLTTYEWSDWRNGTVWWVHSVYVGPGYRGMGIYRGLYGHVQELAKADPAIRGLRLYVDKRNQNAQRVYERLGMNGDHYQLFEWMKTF